MDGKPSIFDTTVIGAIFFVCFGVTVLVVNPDYFVLNIKHYGPIVFGKDNLLAKWVAIGVASNIFGAIIQMISICCFTRPFDEPSARECLQSRVVHWIDKYNKNKNRGEAICPEARSEIASAHPDSIFAWIHYSDPRKELIEWGRRKLHYAYLAENWMVSIVLGSGLGFILGLAARYGDPWLLYKDPASWWKICSFSFEYEIFVVRGFWVLLYGIISVIAICRLNKLRNDNKKYDRDMIAIYAVGRVWQDLEDAFLPKVQERVPQTEQATKERQYEKEGPPNIG